MEDVEAVLFLTPKPMKTEEIAKLLEKDIEYVRRSIEELRKKYNGGVIVEEFLDAYRLGVRQEYLWIAKKLGVLPEFTNKELRVIGLLLKKGSVKLSELKKVYSGADKVVEKLKSFGFVAVLKQGRSKIVRKTKLLDKYFMIEESG